MRVPGNCILKMTKTRRYEIRPRTLGDMIQYMKYHTMIAKFIGTWLNEKDLIKWIHQWWKPKGYVDLQLGSKGFFMTIFHSSEDKERTVYHGPYFFGAPGLHMRYWSGKFNPNKENFKSVPV